MTHSLKLYFSAFLILFNISFASASVDEKESIEVIKNGFSFKSLEDYLKREGTQSASVNANHKNLTINNKKKFEKSLKGLLTTYAEGLAGKLSHTSLKRFLEDNKETQGDTFTDFEWAGYRPFNITTQNTILQAYQDKQKKALKQALQHGFTAMKKVFEEAVDSSDSVSSPSQEQEAEEENERDNDQSDTHHKSDAEGQEDFEERLQKQSAVIKRLREENKASKSAREEDRQEYEERLDAQKKTIARLRQKIEQIGKGSEIFFEFLGVKSLSDFSDPSQRKQLLARIPTLDLNKLKDLMASSYEEGEEGSK